MVCWRGKRCGGCGWAQFCSKSCHKKSWKRGHKEECPLFKAVRLGSIEEHGEALMEKQMRRVRMYLGPFAVANYSRLGRSVVFVESQHTLEQWVRFDASDTRGNALHRALTLKVWTLGEWDELAFKDNFELAVLRPALAKALEEYDPKTHFVAAFLLGCGWLGVASFPLPMQYDTLLRMATTNWPEMEKEELVLAVDPGDAPPGLGDEA